nr:HipA N-terminal domain-containing protein [Pseudomonas sp. B21-015]
MKMASLKVSTPEGSSGRILTSAEDFIFRYDEDALPNMAISLTMPVRPDEFRRRDLHPIFQMNLPEGYVLELPSKKRRRHLH